MGPARGALPPGAPQLTLRLRCWWNRPRGSSHSSETGGGHAAVDKAPARPCVGPWPPAPAAGPSQPRSQALTGSRGPCCRRAGLAFPDPELSRRESTSNRLAHSATAFDPPNPWGPPRFAVDAPQEASCGQRRDNCFV